MNGLHAPRSLSTGLLLLGLLGGCCPSAPPPTAAPTAAPPPAAVAVPGPAVPGGDHLDPVAAAAIAAEGSPPLQAAPAAPAPADGSGPRFAEVATASGIDFRYTFGDYAYDNILESSGSGVTWFDADDDGDLDLFLPNGCYVEGASDPKGRAPFADARDGFFRNEGNGRFVDATAAAGLGDGTWSMSGLPADFDGDGRLDLFVANYGPNRLYRNQGDGTFVDVAGQLGLVGPASLNGFVKWSAGGAWFDAEGDGDLDLVVCNFLAFDPAYLHPGKEWEMPDPKEYRGQASLFYRQEADGRFVDATEQAGLLRPESKCMGITVLDFDGDGRLDLFQGNDHQPNFLFRARGDGTYEELGWASGLAVNGVGIGTGSMHGTPADVDGDGRLDLLVVDLEYGALYRQVSTMLFEDVTRSSGVGRVLEGLDQWGAVLQDLDLDGDVDLFTTNGIAYILVEQSPALAVNDGHGQFRDARAGAGEYFAGHRSGRGAAWADYDNDGDVDLLVSHLDYRATPALLRNDTPRRDNHWIGFELRTARPGGAVGATVTVRAGGRSLLRVAQPGSSYLSQSDPRLHFGLGPAQRVDVTVQWPGAGSQDWPDLAVDGYWRLTAGQAAAERRSGAN